jgi:uncharacterized protein YbaR (Trm112 family)/ubiquinone/menaquinone biosynthesis C-methylase UbiE
VKTRLLNILICPACRGDIELSDKAEVRPPGEIEEGSLGCRTCGRVYPIRHGVPNFLLERGIDRRGPWSFDFQWKLKFEGKLEMGPWLWGKDLSRLSYKLKVTDCWHLDCGSGSGDHTRNVALQNPAVQVVGLDRSESVHWANSRDRHIENLHYVRGSILDPPFRDNCFRVLLAVGVWHSTGDTKKALLNSVRLLEPQGFLSSWLYPSLSDLRTSSATGEYRMWRRYYFFRDHLFQGKAHRLPPPVLFAICQAVSLAISPFGHILRLNVPQIRDRYRSNTFILYDDLSPLYQHRPLKKDVLQWFEEAGVSRVVHNFRRGGVYSAIK